MPKLIIEFNCDNDAFVDPEDNDNRLVTYALRHECMKILDELAEEIHNTEQLGDPIHDSNGNTIGHWSFSE